MLYGDTDSMFVLAYGKSYEQAFELGKIIAEEITNSVPHPICLKFEKVYSDLILLAKKRYIGLKFEESPKYD